MSTATVLTDVEAVAMDRAMLQEWIAEQLLRVMARLLRRMSNSRAEMVFTDAPGRIAKLRLRLAQRFGVQRDGAVEVTHDLTDSGRDRPTGRRIPRNRQQGTQRLH